MPATTPWYQGAAVPLTWSPTDTTGAAFTATAATLTITLPDGTSVSPSLTLGSSTLSYTYATTQAGHHVWTSTATATGKADAFADSFEVQPSSDPTIVSFAEAKDILQLTGTTQFDARLQGWNASASQVAEYYCGTVVTRQVTELVRAQGRVLILGKGPVRTDLGTALDPSNRRDGSTTNGLVSITPILSYGFMYDLSQLNVDGPSGIVRQLSGLPFFYSGDPYAQFLATYWAGRKIIDPVIYDGAKIILEHLYAVYRGGSGAQDATWGEATTVVPGFGFAVPNRAIELFTVAAGQASRAAFA